MFGLSDKELENISIDSEAAEFQYNAEKFCNTAKDMQIGLGAAQLIVRNVFAKWLLMLAMAVVEALQRKLNCPVAP